MGVMTLQADSSPVGVVGAEGAPASPVRKGNGRIIGLGYGGVLLGTALVFLIPGMKAGWWQHVVVIATMATMGLGAALVVWGMIWGAIKG